MTLCQTLFIIRLSLSALLQINFLMQKYSYGYVPMRAVLSVCCGGHFAHKVRCKKLVWGMDLNGWGYTGVHKTILSRERYCSNPNPKPNSQSVSWVPKGPGTQAPGRIWEYDLATAIAIWSLKQPLTCEISSYILAAMSRSKVAITPCDQLPSILLLSSQIYICIYYLSSFV